MKKMFLITILILSIVLSNSIVFAQGISVSKAVDKNFTDIDKHWAEEAINMIVDKDTFMGKDGKFVPGKPITRSEFVMMLHKALGIEIMYFKAPDITETFEDVKNEDAYADALIDLVTTNIIDYKGKFRPNDTLPRDEMVHYIINSLEYMTGGNYALIKMMPAPFADDEKINSVYKYDFVKAQLLKIIAGRGNNMFHPKDEATRAEAATIIFKLKKVLQSLIDNVQVSSSVYKSESGMTMKLMIANNSKEAVTINHTSGQKFDFALLDADKNVLYRWSADKLFIMALSETVIEPGKSIEFSADLEEDIFNKVKGKAVAMKAYIVGESKDFKINSDGYEKEINW